MNKYCVLKCNAWIANRNQPQQKQQKKNIKLKKEREKNPIQSEYVKRVGNLRWEIYNSKNV